MNENETKVDPAFEVAKTCDIASVLKPATIKLLATNPENVVFRTLVLQELKRPLPDEAKTWEQIVDWVQHNISVTKPAAQRVVLSVSAVYLRETRGRCDYTDRERGRATPSLTLADIMELADSSVEDGDNWEEFCEDVTQAMREGVDQIPPNLDSVEGYPNYSNYDADDDETSTSVSIDRDVLSDALRSLMRRHLPRLLDSIDGF
jgi:hypothetical protein